MMKGPSTRDSREIMNKKEKQTREEKIKVMLYSSVSNLQKTREFSSLDDFVKWFQHFDGRSFCLNWHEDRIAIGFTPTYFTFSNPEEDYEESVESIDKALLEGVEL